MDIKVPSEFNTIRNSKFEIEDGKIYNRLDYFLLGFLEVFFSILLSAALVALINFDFNTGKMLSAKNDFGAFWAAIFTIVQLVFYNRFIRFHNVVDFSNACVYKEFLFFGLRFWFSYYPKDQIVQIGNNIYGQIPNPGGKNGMVDGKRVLLNPETNLFDYYQVSILMENGKTINFEFGYFDEEYRQTLRFVSLLSNYWNIPSVRCNKNYHLVVCESKNNSYALVEEKMPYCSHLKKLIFFSIALVVLYSIVYYTMVFFDKYDYRNSNPHHYNYRPSYRHRR